MLTIYRRDPSRNMARFYAVGLQADLLDGCSVVRKWGRVGWPEWARTDLHGG
jgi:predicted DNA-binding WGR domain protein